jgi:hypothetical protein
MKRLFYILAVAALLVFTLDMRAQVTPLLIDGFETGDFSLWSSTYEQRHSTLVADTTLPHTGTHSADIHYNTWTTDCGGANSCDDNTNFTVNLGGSHGLDQYSFRGYVYMHINPGGATGIGSKLFRNQTSTSGCGVGNVQESELTLLCNLTPVCSTNIIMTGCDADGTTSLGIVVNPPNPPLDHRSSIVAGALAGRTYYITMSWVSPGGEGLIGGQISSTISANKLFKFLAPDLPAGSPGTYTISGWNIYVGTISGQTYLQNSTPMGTATDWTEPSSCPTTCLAGTYLRDDLGIKTKTTFPFDQWLMIENETRLNDLGASNGYITYWLDGTPIAHYEGINSRGTRDIGIKNFQVGRQTNRTAGSCGSPPCLVDENRYWDDIEIASGSCGVPPCIGPLGGVPEATPSPASVNFNNTTVGNTCPECPVVITLTNDGGATVNISDISITGAHAVDFAMDATTCGATLAASASCTVDVSFTPLGVGLHTAAVTFVDDAPGSPQSVSLSGTGTGAPPAPAVSLSVSAINFDARIVGSTSDAQQVLLYNSGDGTLNITSIVASTTSAPTTPGDFAIDSTTCGATLAAAASCAVNISFTPVAGGSRTGRIRFTTDAATSPDDVSTSGTGQIVLTLRGGTFRGMSKN